MYDVKDIKNKNILKNNYGNIEYIRMQFSNIYTSIYFFLICLTT